MTHCSLSKLVCSTLLFVSAALPTTAQPITPAGPVYRTISPDAAATQMGGLTLVTLDVKDAPLQSVLDEIAKQTGFQLKASQGETTAVPRLLTLKLDRQPFWLAVKAIMHQTNTSFLRLAPPNVPSDQDTLMGSGARMENLKGILSSQGPFLVIANSLQRTTTTRVDFEANQKEDAATDNARLKRENYAILTFSLFNDPKLTSLTGAAIITVETAVDENGRSLKSSESSHTYYGSFFLPQTMYNQRLSTGLALPAGMEQRIAKLSGDIYVYQALKTETWEIPNALIAPHTTKTISSNGQTKTYGFEGVTKTDNDYEVNFRINAESSEEFSGIADGQRRASNSVPSLRLIDSAGTPLARSGSSSSSHGGNMSLKLKFSARQLRPGQAPILEGPLKLVIDIPTDLVEIKVPFEFTDLPLR